MNLSILNITPNKIYKLLINQSYFNNEEIYSLHLCGCHNDSISVQ